MIDQELTVELVCKMYEEVQSLNIELMQERTKNETKSS